MIIMAGVLIYVFLGCVAVSALGGGSSLGVVLLMLVCVVAFVAMLFFAPEIVNMKINISF